jgi:hypothetical protein
VITAAVAGYLEVVEKEAFMPVGQLYYSVYAGLLCERLVEKAPFDGFKISPKGREELAAFRAQAGATCA